jgi:hypothetical protein
MFSVGSQFFLLVEHHELRAFPRFSGFFDPPPHLVIDLVKAAADKIVPGLFPGDRRTEGSAILGGLEHKRRLACLKQECGGESEPCD